jgi:hypothetical protein
MFRLHRVCFIGEETTRVHDQEKARSESNSENLIVINTDVKDRYHTTTRMITTLGLVFVYTRRTVGVASFFLIRYNFLFK